MTTHSTHDTAWLALPSPCYGCPVYAISRYLPQRLRTRPPLLQFQSSRHFPLVMELHGLLLSMAWSKTPHEQHTISSIRIMKQPHDYRRSLTNVQKPRPSHSNPLTTTPSTANSNSSIVWCLHFHQARSFTFSRSNSVNLNHKTGNLVLSRT